MNITSKRNIYILILLLSILFYSHASFAMTIDDIIHAATGNSDDMAYKSLYTIFGDIINNPLDGNADDSSATILSEIFKVTNESLLVIGATICAYKMTSTIIGTAHDGSMFDKSRHVAWGPIRVLLGISFIVPLANGWSLAQLLMLWFALQGSGVANLGVNAAVTALSNGESMIMRPTAPETTQLARSLFESNLCRSGINASLQEIENSGGEVRNDDFINQELTNNSTGFILKSKYYVCGGANTITPPSSEIDTTTIKNAHIIALSNMQSKLYTDSDNFVQAIIDRQNGSNAKLPNSQSIIENAAHEYENTIASKLQSSTDNESLNSLTKSISDSIKTNGWAGLGAWYQTFAVANNQLGTAAAAKASAFKSSVSSEPPASEIYDSALMAYKTQQSTITNANTSTANSIYNAPDTTDSVISNIFGNSFSNFSSILNRETTTNNQVNPLITMKNTGDHIIDIADSAVGFQIGAAVAQGLSGSFIGKALNFFTGGPKMLKNVLSVLGTYITIIVIALMSMGILLSIYLPLSPFIIFFSAFINWLVIVGEAVIAAPLWAMAHIISGGEGMGQKTTHGYIFLLNLFCRPILMVLGFFLGSSIMEAGGTILNELLPTAIANAQYDSFSGIASFIGWFFVYTTISLTLINSSFSLVHIVPDQVINWIGGSVAPTLGRDTSDKIISQSGVSADKGVGVIKELEHKSGVNSGNSSGSSIK